MEANILINKNKYELKYIRVQPRKLVSDTLKPGNTQFNKGRYWWSKQTSYEMEPLWVSDNLFNGITESTIKNSNKYQVIDNKLYLRPLIEIVFDNTTLVERFDDDQELNDRLIYLRANVFVQPEVKLAQINAQDFEPNYGQWYSK